MRRRSASSASSATVLARIRLSRRCATSACACTRSSGGICPASTFTLFSRANSCASSSDRCCTAMFARVAFSVQYACFTAAMVCTTASRKRRSEVSRLRFAIVYWCRAASIVRSRSKRLRERQLKSGLQGGIEAGDRAVRRRPRAYPRKCSTCRIPTEGAVARPSMRTSRQRPRHARRTAGWSTGSRRSTDRVVSRTPARTRRGFRRRVRPRPLCRAGRLSSSGLFSTARRTASSSVRRSVSTGLTCAAARRSQQQTDGEHADDRSLGVGSDGHAAAPSGETRPAMMSCTASSGATTASRLRASNM